MNAYAGIGSRETPLDILYWMNEIASYMSKWNWILRSGGAAGADSAFEQSASYKEIYLPWKYFNNNNSKLWLGHDPKAHKIAKHVWNDRFKNNKVKIEWCYLKPVTIKFMVRNCYQILGAQLNDPVKLVICWTKDGEASGGTGQALWLAKLVTESKKIDSKITIINLQKESHREKIRTVMKENKNPLTLCELQ